jgi:predicted transcriptional regulator
VRRYRDYHVRLDDTTIKGIEKMAKIYERPKGYIMRKAIKEWLNDVLPVYEEQSEKGWDKELPS